MDPDKLLLIGKITRPHGICGEVRVSAYVDQKRHLQPGSRVIVEAPDQQPAQYRIETARSHKNGLLIGFAGVGDRSSAEAVSGASLFMPRSDLPPAEPDTWYWCDLIGLAVYEADGGFVGRVESMIETGSNDVFVVRQGQNERLIPAIEQVVKEIDLEGGKITVDLPEGL
ncbi:MAG: ribosome maturation factor RimM [Desulfosalsimonas sp.]